MFKFKRDRSASFECTGIIYNARKMSRIPSM